MNKQNTKTTPQLRWFARGGGVAKMGPFRSQAAAAAAIMGLDGLPVPDAFIWLEARTR